MGLLAYLVMAVVSIVIVRRVFLPISLRASAALILLPLLFVLRAFITNGVYAPIDLAYQTEPLVSYLDTSGVHMFHNSTLSDTYAQMIPWRAVVREAIFAGEWPLMNPYMLAGDLLAGSAQPAPYDFFNLAGLIVPLIDSINLTAALAFLWAAIGAFLLARRFDLSELPALFAAAAWMMSSFVVFFIEAALGHTMLLLPLVCCAAIDVVRRPSIGRAIVLAIVLTWVILAGHPEGLLQVVVIGCAFGIYELWCSRENRGRAIVAALAAGIAALLLSAIFLLPVIEALRQTEEFSNRRAEGSEDLVTMSWKRSAQKLPVNVIPFVYGLPWKEMGNAAPLVTPHSAAIGGVFLALAVVGAIFTRRRARFFLLAVAATGLLAGIGFPPLVRIFGHIPLLSLARNERFIAATLLALVLLTAMGIEVWYRTIGWTMLATATVTSILAITLIPVMRGVALSETFIRTSIASLVIPMFLGAALLLIFRRVEFLLVLALVQRVADVGGMYPTLPRDAFYREPAALKRLVSREPFRFAAQEYTLLPNIGAHYGLEDVRGFQAMSLRRLHETYPLWSSPQRNWFNRIDSLASPFLSFLNVRYALHDPDRPLPPLWKSVGNAGRLEIVENSAALPRAFMPAAVRLNVPYPAVIEEMRNTQDFRAMGWINQRDAPQGVTEKNGSGKVSISRTTLSTYAIHADVVGDGWIVISQAAWKGWRAFEGRDEIPVRVANHAFLAMRLSRGHHDVALVFRPRGFIVGRAISCMALVGVILVGLWSLRSA
ncbi:MAG TPA: YfhO family protein [Thermoanaerobaculia bacterium]|nr:YfhO family protein [Thermoanaerobaculia bacterium]